MQRCVRQALLTLRHDFDQSVLEERWFATRDAQFGRLGINQLDQSQMLANPPAVIDVLRRLRAHQTKAVAAIGREQRVMRRVLSVKSAYVTTRVDRDDIARLKVIYRDSVNDGNLSRDCWCWIADQDSSI